MSRLLHVYPAAWRERYEAEVDDLLEARPPSVRDRLDLIRGAADAWRHPQIVKAAAAVDSADRSWGRFVATILAVLGGSLWAAGGVAMKTAPYIASLGYKESSLGVELIVFGAIVTGLAAVAIERSRSRPSPAMARTGAAMVVLALVMLAPWPVLIIGFVGYLIATAGFGGALVKDEARPLGVILAISALTMFSFNTEDDRALIAVPFGVIWILIGLLALRSRPVALPAPAGA